MKDISFSKDIGTCLRYVGTTQVFRSKYKKQSDVQEQLSVLKSMNVIDHSYEVYKCPICHTWHMGLKEWSKL